MSDFRSICQHSYLLFLFFSFLFSYSTYGVDTNTPPGAFVFQSWSVREGLPQDAVASIAQTNEGYLWVGTQEGLVRFDGQRFTTFTPRTLPELPHKSVRAITTDHLGRLWVGTLNGLAMLENGRWKDMTYILQNRGVFVAAPGPDHCIWFGTNKGLTRYCSESSYRTFTTVDGLVSEQIRSISFDNEGNMFVGTRVGLFHYKDRKFHPFPQSGYFKNLPIIASLFHKDVLYIGTDGHGVHTIRSGAISALGQKTIGTSPITSISSDSSSNIWIGTHLGLFRLTPRGISEFPKDHVLSKSFIRVVFEDRDKNLWIGSHHDGLHRIRDGALTTMTKEGNGLAGDVVYTVFQDRNENIWVGTESGVSVLNAAFEVLYNIQTPSVTSIAQGAEDEMWFGTYREGLIRFRNGSMERYKIGNGLPSDQIRSLLALKDGTIWIGTGLGVAILRKGKIEVPANFPRNPVTSMLADDQHRLWFATQGEGLLVYDNGAFRWIGPMQGLISNQIFALTQISEGHILIGTHGDGLFISNGSVIQRIGSEFGFSQDSISTIVPDDYGRIWFGWSGIFHTDKRALLDVFKNRSGTLTNIVYGTDDGMKHPECSAGNQPVSYRTKSGHLLFATMKGLVIADPSKISTKPKGPGELLIEKVLVDGVEHSREIPVVVAAGSKRIEIQYSSLTFISPETVSFKRKLEPFEQNWIDADTKRSVSYTNLSPGDYAFSLLAVQNGVTSHEPLVLSLTILPYFYQRKLFYFFLGLLLIGTGVVIHRLRIRSMVARNRQLEQIIISRTEALEEVIKSGAALEERNRIAQELHDTVAQGLSALTVQLRVALNLNQSEEAEAILQNALGLAKQSLQETRAAVLSIRPSSLSRAGIVGALQELARYYTAGSGLQLSVSVNGEPFPLADEMELNLLRISQEAISNAIRHSQAKNLWIILSYTAESLEVRLEDDGCGLTEKFVSHSATTQSLGLIGMTERAMKIGANLTIDSPNGRGTRVICKVVVSPESSDY